MPISSVRENLSQYWLAENTPFATITEHWHQPNHHLSNRYCPHTRQHQNRVVESKIIDSDNPVQAIGGTATIESVDLIFQKPMSTGKKPEHLGTNLAVRSDYLSRSER